MKKNNKDYYSLFRLTPEATQEEIKKAYRKLAILYHPDRNPKDPLAEGRFRVLQEAYNVLGDPGKKRIYDQSLRFFSQTNLRYRRGGGESRSNSRSGTSHSQNRSSEGRGRRETPHNVRRETSQSFQSEHLRYTLSLRLEDVAKGVEKKISFVRRREGIESQAQLSVKVPAGIREGQRLKLKGEGESFFRGSAPGDLYIIISIQSHPLFHREGNNVFMALPLSFKDAILGAKIDVPTLWGVSVLTVPSYTSSGKILCLKKQGFPSSERRGSYGDMMVKVIIDIPRHLGKRDLKEIRKLNLSNERYPLVEEYEKKFKTLRKSA